MVVMVDVWICACVSGLFHKTGSIGLRACVKQVQAHNLAPHFVALVPQLLEISDFTLEPAVSVLP